MPTMITMNRVRAIAAALLGVMLVAPSAQAQGKPAVIVGTITTEFGRPIEAANVYINDLSISVATSVLTSPLRNAANTRSR